MKILKKFLIPTIALVTSIFIIGFSITTHSIYTSVATTCMEAMSNYKNKDCVEALLIQLDSNKYSAREKNKFIWTLGQLADKKALPALENIYYTGVTNNKEPLEEVISQYELKKAIKWCKKGNITNIMYGKFKD